MGTKGISLEMFKDRMSVLETDYKSLDDATEKFNQNNPFLVDSQSVPRDWLTKIIEHELENIFLAVNPEMGTENAIGLAEYVFMNSSSRVVDGEITTDLNSKPKKYNLGNMEQLYEYLVEQF